MGSYKITENRKRKGIENRWSKYKTNSNIVDLNPTRFKSNLNTDNYIKWKDLNIPIKRQRLSSWIKT